MTWAEIADRHGTDKGDRVHGYMPHYQAFLGDQPITSILEIGVESGASLRMWAEIFPYARIIGVDIDPECKAHEDERIEIVIGDATDPRVMVPLMADSFDLIVDDGSHHLADVIATFDLVRFALASGGVYAVEDVRIGPHHRSMQPAPAAEVIARMVGGLQRVDVRRLHLAPSLFAWGEDHTYGLILAELA